METKDRVAIVVGASGGIGREIARRFYDEGMIVALAARNKERLEETVKALGFAEGRYLVVPCDASQAWDAYRLIKNAKDRYGSVDLVVISSGGYESLGLGADRFELKTMVDAYEIFDKMIRGNLVACFNIAFATAVIMKEQKSGFIANISSHAAFKVLPRGLAYSPSKAGARSLMMHFAKELEPYGVRVVDIEPSTVSTLEMQKYIPEGQQHLAVQPEEIAQKIVELFLSEEKFEVCQPMIGELPDF